MQPADFEGQELRRKGLKPGPFRQSRPCFRLDHVLVIFLSPRWQKESDLRRSKSGTLSSLGPPAPLVLTTPGPALPPGLDEMVHTCGWEQRVSPLRLRSPRSSWLSLELLAAAGRCRSLGDGGVQHAAGWPQNPRHRARQGALQGRHRTQGLRDASQGPRLRRGRLGRGRRGRLLLLQLLLVDLPFLRSAVLEPDFNLRTERWGERKVKERMGVGRKDEASTPVPGPPSAAPGRKGPEPRLGLPSGPSLAAQAGALPQPHSGS